MIDIGGWKERAGRWGFVRWGTGIFQFRILDWGLSCLRENDHAQTFSERMGIERVLRVAGWRVRLLRPSELGVRSYTLSRIRKGKGT